MKMRRPHLVPLSRQALAILEELKTMTSGYQYVFPGRLEKVKPISDMSLNVLIRRIGYGGRATGHGFRHTMSTICMSRALIQHGLSYSLPMIRTAFAALTTMRSIWMAGER